MKMEHRVSAGPSRGYLILALLAASFLHPSLCGRADRQSSIDRRRSTHTIAYSFQGG